MLPHFGLITFRFHFGDTQNAFMFTNFRFRGVPRNPKFISFHFWRRRDTSNDSWKFHNCLDNIIAGNLKILHAQQFGKVWKRLGPTNPQDPSFYLKIWNWHFVLNMESMFSNKLELGSWRSWRWDHYLRKRAVASLCWIWDQDFQKTWNWNLAISIKGTWTLER